MDNLKESIIKILEEQIKNISETENYTSADLNRTLNKIIDGFSDKAPSLTDICVGLIKDELNKKYKYLNAHTRPIDQSELYDTLFDNYTNDSSFNTYIVDSEMQNLLFNRQADELVYNIKDEVFNLLGIDDINDGYDIKLIENIPLEPEFNFALINEGLNKILDNIIENQNLNDTFTYKQFIQAFEKEYNVKIKTSEEKER